MGEIKVTCFAVGQGNANLIEMYNTEGTLTSVSLIDSGGASPVREPTNNFFTYMLGLLNANPAKVPLIDEFLLTHQDKDHWELICKLMLYLTENKTVQSDDQLYCIKKNCGTTGCFTEEYRKKTTPVTTYFEYIKTTYPAKCEDETCYNDSDEYDTETVRYTGDHGCTYTYEAYQNIGAGDILYYYVSISLSDMVIQSLNVTANHTDFDHCFEAQYNYDVDSGDLTAVDCSFYKEPNPIVPRRVERPVERTINEKDYSIDEICKIFYEIYGIPGIDVIFIKNKFKTLLEKLEDDEIVSKDDIENELTERATANILVDRILLGGSNYGKTVTKKIGELENYSANMHSNLRPLLSGQRPLFEGAISGLYLIYHNKLDNGKFQFGLADERVLCALQNSIITNGTSAMFLLKYRKGTADEKKFLFTGDANSHTMYGVNKSTAFADTEHCVMTAPHHGSSESSVGTEVFKSNPAGNPTAAGITTAFLQKLKYKRVFVSPGYYNNHGHPGHEFMDLLVSHLVTPPATNHHIYCCNGGTRSNYRFHKHAINTSIDGTVQWDSADNKLYYYTHTYTSSSDTAGNTWTHSEGKASAALTTPAPPVALSLSTATNVLSKKSEKSVTIPDKNLFIK